MCSLNNQSAFPHYDGLQSHLCLHDKSDLQINIYIFFFCICCGKDPFKEVFSRTRRTTCDNHYNENQRKMSISPVKRGKKTKIPRNFERNNQNTYLTTRQSCMILPNWFQVCEPAIFSVFKELYENDITDFKRSFLNFLVVVALGEMLIIMDSKMYLIPVFFLFCPRRQAPFPCLSKNYVASKSVED